MNIYWWNYFIFYNSLLLLSPPPVKPEGTIVFFAVFSSVCLSAILSQPHFTDFLKIWFLNVSRIYDLVSATFNQCFNMNSRWGEKRRRLCCRSNYKFPSNEAIMLNILIAQDNMKVAAVCWTFLKIYFAHKTTSSK